MYSVDGLFFDSSYMNMIILKNVKKKGEKGRKERKGKLKGRKKRRKERMIIVS